MPDWRQMGDLNMLYRSTTCLIEDPLETDMPVETHQRPTLRFQIYFKIHCDEDGFSDC